jgi:hypothetical protein
VGAGRGDDRPAGPGCGQRDPGGEGVAAAEASRPLGQLFTVYSEPGDPPVRELQLARVVVERLDRSDLDQDLDEDLDRELADLTCGPDDDEGPDDDDPAELRPAATQPPEPEPEREGPARPPGPELPDITRLVREDGRLVRARPVPPPRPSPPRRLRRRTF